MIEYMCNKCNKRTRGEIRTKGNQIGLYCTHCGAWIKWLSKQEYRHALIGRDTNTYHCFEKKIDCEYANKFGDCSVEMSARLCEGATVAGAVEITQKIDLPNELTINGVVYVRKQEIK